MKKKEEIKRRQNAIRKAKGTWQWKLNGKPYHMTV